jgi:hypothetical protein
MKLPDPSLCQLCKSSPVELLWLDKRVCLQCFIKKLEEIKKEGVEAS